MYRYFKGLMALDFQRQIAYLYFESADKAWRIICLHEASSIKGGCAIYQIYMRADYSNLA